MYTEKTHGWVNKRGKAGGGEVDFHVKNARHVAIYKPLQKISWGEPAEICQAITDKQCPRCSAVKGEPFFDKHDHYIPGGFEMGYDSKGGIFGALCHNCGWSF